jgi:hypothetical protein
MNTFTITFKNKKGLMISKDFLFDCHTVQKAQELFENSNEASARSITKH